MKSDKVLSCLRELRDAKFTLAAGAFRRYYDAVREGRCEESRVIRCGAIRELQELFTLERWIASISGSVDCTDPSPEARRRRNGPADLGRAELGERCRLLRLLNQRLTAWNGNAVTACLRSFLTELAAEEAGRVNALLTRRVPESC